MRFEALTREGEGHRHTGDAAADHERGFGDADLTEMQRFEQVRLAHGATDQRLGLTGGAAGLALVHPRALFPDVDHLEQVLVEARFAQRLLEQRLVRPRRAGGDDDTVQALLPDGLLDRLLCVLGAGVERVLRVGDPAQRSGVRRDFLDVHNRGDVRAAVTDEHAGPHLLPDNVHLRRVLRSADLSSPGCRQEFAA